MGKDEKIKFTVYLPEGLHAQAVAVAEKEQRSLNGHIVFLIQSDLEKRAEKKKPGR